MNKLRLKLGEIIQTIIQRWKKRRATADTTEPQAEWQVPRRMLTLGLVMLGLAVLTDIILSRPINIKLYENSIRNHLAPQEELASRTLSDTNFVNWILSGGMLNNAESQAEFNWLLDNIERQPMTLMVYENDSLKYWSNQTARPFAPMRFPAQIERDSAGVGISLFSFDQEYLMRNDENKSSQYQMRFRKYLRYDSLRMTLVVLIPIKWSFPMFNYSSQLETHFPSSSLIPSTLLLTENKTPYPLRSKEGIPFCYLDNSKMGSDPLHDYLFFTFFCISLFCFAHIGTRRAQYLIRQQQEVQGSVVFFLSLGGTLAAMWLVCNVLAKTPTIKVFSQTREFKTPYAEGTLVGSVPELLFYVVLMLWLAIFFNSQFQPSLKNILTNEKRDVWRRAGLTLIAYFSTILLFQAIVSICKILVTSTNIHWAFENFFEFTFDDGLALLAIGLMFLSLFLVAFRWIALVQELDIKPLAQIGLIEFATILVYACFWLVGNVGVALWVMSAMTLLYMLLMVYFVKYYHSNVPASVMLFIGLLMSAFIAAVILRTQGVEEDNHRRERCAISLVNETDPTAEYRIKEFKQLLETNPSLRTNSNPLQFNKPDTLLISRTVDEYFENDGYLQNHYDLAFHVVPSLEGIVLLRGDNEPLWSQKKPMSTPIDAGIFHYINPNGTNAYLVEATIQLGNGTASSAFDYVRIRMVLTRKSKTASRIFTNLLVNDQYQYKLIPHLHRYLYAVYKKGICIEENHIGSYDRFLDSTILPKENRRIAFRHDKSRHDDLILKAENGTVVIVGRDWSSGFQLFTILSYCFLLFGLLLLAIVLINRVFRFLPPMIDIGFRFEQSLRDRIVVGMATALLMVMFGIGFAAYHFFNTTTENYFDREYQSKTALIVKSAISEILKTDTSDIDTRKTNLANRLRQLSEVHQIALHFFKTNGQLDATSESIVFDKNILSKAMDPKAFRMLNAGRFQWFTAHERVGRFNYKTMYYAIRDDKQHILGFLELPLYTLNQKIGREISDFFGSIITVMCVILWFSIGLILWLAKQTIDEIQTLGQTLKTLTLGKTNAKVPPRRDELGMITDAYNYLVDELDEKTKQLQDMEREATWREMASQVAHEIRNPLMPMKLSVQHLENVRKYHADKIPQFLERTNKMILQQIETFERIVSAFTNVAKMPQAHNEPFVINDLVQASETMFNKFESHKTGVNTSTQITFEVCEMRYQVIADKSLLGNAINNLILNATEAITNDREDGLVEVALYEQNGYAVIRVRDNGTGIPDDIKDKIFKPKFTTKSYGSGLGLMYTRNIIQSVGGKLYFHTELNVGTEFYVELEIQGIATGK